MKSWALPSIWDARKLAIRYGLNNETDFLVREGFITIFPSIPDDPPIFEPPDPPGPTEKELLEQRLTKIETDIIDLKASPI